MLENRSSLFLIASLLAMSGCDAVGVSYTKDPARKLDNAQTMQSLDRPVLADLFIHEAIDIYKKKNDDTGLAYAYKAYAFFLNNPSFAQWKKYYGHGKFMDSSVTLTNRNEKGIEYLRKARDLFAQQKNYSELTNVDHSLGATSEYLKHTSEACMAYDRSLVDYRQMVAVDPGVPMHLPKQFSTYEDYIAFQKGHAGCPDLIGRR